MLDTLRRDVRFACRIFARSPLFTLAAVLTLAIAIGVNTAVFSVVDAVLLKPLPYPDPDRLSLVSRIVTSNGVPYTGLAVNGRSWEAVRDGVQSARSAVFSNWVAGVNLHVPSSGAGQARHVVQQRVGAGFFDALGVRPAIGREFSIEEDRAGGPPVTILSAGLWRSFFGSDPAIVGRTVMLKGAASTVVGVMPDGFQTGQPAELWTPLRASRTGEGGGENYGVLLRLRDGADWSQTSTELARISADLERESPPPNDTVRIGYSFEPLHSGMTADLRQPLIMLWSAVGIVLVVACVNLAGLLLARGSRRSREIATRMALGSGRYGVIRQLFIESVVLSILGAIGGIGVGSGALQLLTWLARDVYDLWQPVGIDSRSVAAALGLSLVASVLFGILPAWQATRLDIQRGLTQTSARAVAGGASRWPRRLVIVSQVALGVVLLVAAGLLVRTFSHLRALDPGFDPDNVITAAISLQDERYTEDGRAAQLFERTLAGLHDMPGIESAAVALELPYTRLLNLGFKYLDGPEAAGDRNTITNLTYVSPGFFEALRIPLIAGRAFTDADRAGSPPVVILSEAFARTYFGGAMPTGRRIAVAGAEREIVGVSGDVQVRPGWGSRSPIDAMPLAYVPATQVSGAFMRLVHVWFSPTFVVRSAIGPAGAAAALRRALDSTDPTLPFASVRSMDEVKEASLAQQRFLMALLVGLAAVAVVLAGIGIHGLIATTVAERTREIGIRIALGATLGRAMRTIAVPGLVLASVGIGIGLAASWAIVGTLQSFVYGVSATDPVTFVAVAVILLIVAALASLLPALRILRLDPALTLRQE